MKSEPCDSASVDPQQQSSSNTTSSHCATTGQAVNLGNLIPITHVKKLFDDCIAPKIRVDGESEKKNLIRINFYRSIVLEIASAQLSSRTTLTPEEVLQIAFSSIETSGVTSLTD